MRRMEMAADQLYKAVSLGAVQREIQPPRSELIIPFSPHRNWSVDFIDLAKR